MKYAAAGVVLIGALVVYLARILFRAVKKREPEDRELTKLKFAGLLVALAGVALLFLSDRM